MPTVTRFTRFAAGFFLAFTLFAASLDTGFVQNEDPLAVVASTSIVGDLVANVGGDQVEILTMVAAGVDPHTFEPTPEQVVELTEAFLIFEIGVEYEPWLDDIYSASGSDATRVVLSDRIELRTSEDIHHDEEADHDGAGSPEATSEDDESSHEEDGDHEEGDGHDHDHGEFDPHIWQSVANAQTMVEQIRDQLIIADPENSPTYKENADRYIAELQVLDGEIFDGIGSIPEDRRLLVTSHDTFGYYADRYGLEIVGTALPFTTEGGDPAASEIKELIEAIEETGAPAIFPETTTNPDLMQQIADDAGVNLGPPLYTDSLGQPGTPGDTYAGMMRFNTEAIIEALGT